MTFAALLTILGKHWKLALTIAGITVVALLIGYQYACGTSPLERKIEEKGNEIIEQRPVEKVAEEEAKETRTEAKEAVNKAREAKNVNKRGTTIEEANRNRCVAYPDDPGCK
jgi:hypothetical protein